MLKKIGRIGIILAILICLFIPAIPVYAAVPTITSFTPTSGPENTAIIITGTGFYNGGSTSAVGSVLIGSTPVKSYTVYSDTTIVATVGAGTSGGHVIITTSGGSVTSAGTFTISNSVPAPTISSFTPSSGATGNSVIITGTGFYGGGSTSDVTNVMFGNTLAASFTVHSDTSITAIVGNGSTGVISVTTSGGTVTSASTFTFMTAQPSKTPTITNIHINTNLYQTGDILIYGLYNIPFTNIPTVNADQNFNIYLMDAGLATYGMANLYVYHDNGYNHGIISFYFPPGVISWGSEYFIRMEEEPDQFASPVDTDINIPLSAYSLEVTKEDNQLELANKLYVIGQTLESEYGKVFFTSSGGRQILTDDGQTYFQGAIPGLVVMAPSIFLFEQKSANLTPSKTYTTVKFDTYASRFAGTWVGDAMDAGGSMLGMAGNTFMMFIFTLPLCLGAVIFTALKFGKPLPGFRLAALFMIMSALMGWMPIALFAFVFQFYGIYIGYLLFFSRSGDAFDIKNIGFLTFCYFISILISLILEGSFFGSAEKGIFNSLSVITYYPLPIIGPVPVFDANFLDTLGKILTWNYSFYTGSYELLHWFWFFLLTPGVVIGAIRTFIGLWPSIIAIFRPSISV